MNFTNLFKIAVRALANNKLRGFLTMLGIIIGVASVITMLAIGQGSKRSIQREISEMGSNMIMIQPGGEMRDGVRQSAEDMQTLTLSDYEDIVNETRYVAATSPSVNSSGQIIYARIMHRPRSMGFPRITCRSGNTKWLRGICSPSGTSSQQRRCA